MKRRVIIAVDGPAAAGKSVVSRQLAQRLGFRYIDTGAMYRAVGLLAQEQGIDPEDEEQVDALCRGLRIDFREEGNSLRIVVNERDVTQDIRSPHVGQWASRVSAQEPVRRTLVEIQRCLGQEGNVVVEGRDIGTVVFPQADVKFYLDAAVEERGRRRLEELRQKGMTASLEETVRELQERDGRDSSRRYAPLQKAEDAVVIDTTALTIAQAVEVMRRIVEECMKSCK